MTQSGSPSRTPSTLYYEGKTLADMERMLRQGYLTSSGWLESADRRLAVRQAKPIPWFTYGAIEFLEREISPDLSVFEYGGGQSTRFWAERLRRVVSVDHDPAFGAHIAESLPANAELRVIGEGEPPSAVLEERGRGHPRFDDPERTTRAFRSGQLNEAFRCYGLQILDFPENSFDIVVVDGMARILSTWATLRHFRHHGFIVFDNSDRDFYRPAYEMLANAGYRRIDFQGLGPINPYEWCTSIFYEHRSFTSVRWFPEGRPTSASPAPLAENPCGNVGSGLGILVLGYNRPHHLQSVLESLRLQDQLKRTHVWLDGTQGRAEYAGANEHSVTIARRYQLRELRAHRSHLGIEKMMLDALEAMTAQYERVLVLEDDCFPLEGAVDRFERSLADIADRPEVYSVYGHHFGTEPAESLDFTRFQGWGWAAHSDRIREVLPELKALFLMDEESYCAHVAATVDERIRARLDVTPRRDVLKVLASFFSWDSATALVTAHRGMLHRRTDAPCVKNTGIVPGIGHFQKDTNFLRLPPFNMIPLEEAWAHYDQTSVACDRSAPSYGLDGLDLALLDELANERPGFFIELGAHDGVLQSNSVLLEARGWRGMLIEALPGSYARCVRTRPEAIAENAACVSKDATQSHVVMTDVGLMTLSTRSDLEGRTRDAWLARGEGFVKRPRQEIEVPATTLSRLLDKHGIGSVDLLILDVEGAEIDVLQGLNFGRHAPRMMLVEDAYTEDVSEFLAARGYRRVRVLLERKFTRDCLYRRDPQQTTT